MSTTPILGIDQVAEDQNSKHITINDAFIAIEAAANSKIVVDMSSGDVEMTETVFVSGFVFQATGATATRLLTLPDSVNGVDADRTIIIYNSGAYDLNVEAGSSPANTVLIPAGTSAMLHVGGDTLLVLLTKGAVGANGDEVSMGIFIPGVPDVGAEIFRHVFPRAVSFAANFSGSRGSVGTNPTSSAVFDIQKGGGSVGTITVSTGGVFTYASSGGTPVSFSAGDIITLIAPSPQDATMADIGITLFGSKD